MMGPCIVSIFELGQELFITSKACMMQEGSIVPVAFVVGEYGTRQFEIPMDDSRVLIIEEIKKFTRNVAHVKGLIYICDAYYMIDVDPKDVDKHTYESVKKSKEKREGLCMEIYTPRYKREFRWLYERTERSVTFQPEPEMQTNTVAMNNQIDPWPNRGGSVA